MAGVLPLFPDQGLVIEYPEKASATFAKNDLVALTSGQIDIAGADPTKILGIALKAKTGTTDSLIPVYVIRPGDVFVMKSSSTTAQSNEGVSYGIVTSTGALTVDVSDTTNTRVNVINLDPRDTVGTSGGRLWVTFIQKYLVSGGNNEV